MLLLRRAAAQSQARTFLTTTPTLAKKKNTKAKGAAEFDDFEEDDLFGAPAAPTPAVKVPTKLVSKPKHQAQQKNLQAIKDVARTARFDKEFDWVHMRLTDILNPRIKSTDVEARIRDKAMEGKAQLRCASVEELFRFVADVKSLEQVLTLLPMLFQIISIPSHHTHARPVLGLPEHGLSAYPSSAPSIFQAKRGVWSMGWYQRTIGELALKTCLRIERVDLAIGVFGEKGKYGLELGGRGVRLLGGACTTFEQLQPLLLALSSHAETLPGSIAIDGKIGTDIVFGAIVAKMLYKEAERELAGIGAFEGREEFGALVEGAAGIKTGPTGEKIPEALAPASTEASEKKARRLHKQLERPRALLRVADGILEDMVPLLKQELDTTKPLSYQDRTERIWTRWNLRHVLRGLGRRFDSSAEEATRKEQIRVMRAWVEMWGGVGTRAWKTKSGTVASSAVDLGVGVDLLKDLQLKSGGLPTLPASVPKGEVKPTGWEMGKVDWKELVRPRAWEVQQATV